MYTTWLPDDVKSKLKQNQPIVIVDVREQGEWASGHIPPAKHIPLSELPLRKNELDPSQMTVLVCQSGGRSTLACQHLASAGFKVANMLGGMSQWRGELSTSSHNSSLATVRKENTE
jgi:rhodanese-related sulfurtransferase